MHISIRCHEGRCLREECFGMVGPFCVVLDEEFKGRCPFYKGRSQAVVDRQKAVWRLKEIGAYQGAVAMYGKRMVTGE